MTTEVIPDNLDIFSAPSKLLSVGNSFYEKIQCKTSLAQTNPVLDFTANGDKTHYTDLYNSFLVLEFRYTKDDGSALDAAPDIAPVNNLSGSLFRSTDVYLNNKKITGPEENMAYISFFHHFIAPESVQKNQLKIAGWIPDDYEYIGKAEQNNPNEPGVNESVPLKKRAAQIAASNSVTLVTKLYAAPHTTTRWFPPNCKFDWRFTLHDKSFFTLQKTADEKYQFNIISASIWLRRLSVSPSVALAHSQLLANKNAIFPCQYFQSRVTEIPQNSYTFKFEDIWQGSDIPKAIFMFFVKSKAFKGDVTLNPFVFTTAGLEEVQCHLGSQTLPSIGYTIDTNTLQNENLALLNTYLALDLVGATHGSHLLEKFKFCQGCFVIGIDLSRDGNPLAAYENTSFDASSIRLEGRFRGPLREPHTCKLKLLFF